MAKKRKKKRHNTMKAASWTIGEKSDRQNSPRKEQGRQTHPEPQEGTSFVNPYNFVRAEYDSGCSERKPAENTHERFHKDCLSGRLECRLDLITPLFIPDPENRAPAPNGQSGESLFFNRGTDQKPQIPATSLKGMVRNIFETISCSCFSQINGERLDYRDVEISKDLKPALVRAINKKNDTATIVLLDDMAWLPAYSGTRDLRNSQHQKAERPLFAYANIRKNRFIVKCWLKRGLNDAQDKQLESINKTYHASTSRGRWRAENLSRWDKDDLKRLLRPLCEGKIQVINYNLVVAALENNPDDLPTPGPDEATYQVLIKHTGKTISNKHDERVFFSETYKTDLKANLHKLPSKTISYDRVKNFDYVLQEQYKRCSRQKGESRAAAGAEMRLNRKGIAALQKDDVVYYYYDGGTGKEHLALVLVPRLRYSRAPLDLLPLGLRPCTKIDAMCPACSVFGMVSEQEKSGFKGKVSFSEATFQEDQTPCFADSIRLKILGAPHPTSTNFYLIEGRWNNSRAVTVKDGGYDKPNVMLRGRKFYWQQADRQHPLAPGSYESEPDAGSTKFDKWVELLRPPGRFSFQVDFENLTRDELSLLVWSLEMENDMYHRLGMGKPLGLGTVGITIKEESSFIVDHGGFSGYYSHLERTIDEVKLKDLKVFSTLKGEASKKLRGTKAYEELKAVLTHNDGVAAMVKYPKKMKKVSGQLQPLGYAWFLENRDQPLCTIEEIEQGETQTGWQGGLS